MDCGHVVAKFLKELDVKHIFGLAGSHINPIYDGCFKENIMVIGTRHEQAAAFMADTYSRLSRSLGVCVVTAGPGFTNALTGIAQAYLARSPVLLISGHSELTNINKGALQELDQKTLARPITVYSELVLDANRINDYLIDAVKCALFEQRPSHLAIPIDVLSKKVQKEVVVPKLDSKVIKRIEDREAEKILNMLKNAKKPVIIAGSGVWKSFGDCFGDSSPAVNPPAVKISEADVILAIGVNFDFRLAYGSKLKGKVIHVSSFYEDIWKNLTPEIGLVTNEKWQ